jgi:hypothetical protein
MTQHFGAPVRSAGLLDSIVAYSALAADFFNSIGQFLPP